MEYSIVIPVYNEEDSIEPLHNKLREVLDSLGHSYEIIFVNDGSWDGTQKNLERLQKEREKLVIIKLEKRSGKTCALKRGFARAQGKIIISMDGDLQDDPRDIPFFLSKINEGYDAVCGWRHERKDALSKKLASSIGNVLQNLILRTNLHDLACPLQAYKRECLKDLGIEREGLHRFISYLLQKKGYKVAEVRIRQHARLYGHSKFDVVIRAIKVVGNFFYVLFKAKKERV